MFPGAGRAHAYVVAASCLISVFHFVLSGTAFSFFFLEHTAYALFFFFLCLLCLTALPRSFAAAVTSLRLLFFFSSRVFFFSPFSQSFLHLLLADGKFKESTNNNSNKALRRENRRGFSYLQMRTFVIQAAGCVVHFFFWYVFTSFYDMLQKSKTTSTKKKNLEG